GGITRIRFGGAAGSPAPSAAPERLPQRRFPADHTPGRGPVKVVGRTRTRDGPGSAKQPRAVSLSRAFPLPSIDSPRAQRAAEQSELGSGPRRALPDGRGDRVPSFVRSRRRATSAAPPPSPPSASPRPSPRSSA